MKSNFKPALEREGRGNQDQHWGSASVEISRCSCLDPSPLLLLPSRDDPLSSALPETGHLLGFASPAGLNVQSGIPPFHHPPPSYATATEWRGLQNGAKTGKRHRAPMQRGGYAGFRTGKAGRGRRWLASAPASTRTGRSRSSIAAVASVYTLYFISRTPVCCLPPGACTRSSTAFPAV